MQRRPFRQQGISLIEVMIVVSVLALLLVAVGPEIGTWMRNVQIRNAAESVQNGMQLARAEAMRRNQNVRFSLVSNMTNGCALSSSSASWMVSLEDPAGKCDVAPSDSTSPRSIALRNANEGSASVAIGALQSDLATPATSVTFDGFGRVADTTGIRRMSFDNSASGNNYRALRVELSASGSVRMCDPRVSTTSDDPRRCTS
jgi:type IV fimbrial biogenesis protein FimT